MGSEMDLSWEMSPEQIETVDELTVMIPSQTVRDYVREKGYIFSDLSRAALIYHSVAPLKVRYWLLERLRDSTKEDSLRKWIAHFLERQSLGLAVFPENESNAFAFSVTFNRNIYDGKDPGEFFYNCEDAFAWGKQNCRGLSFDIHKERIGGAVSEDEPNRILYFDGDGRLAELWDYVYAGDDLSDTKYPCFLTTYYDVPNAFVRGDLVQMPGRDTYGIVEYGPVPSLARVQEAGYHFDYSDVALRVTWLVDNEDTPEAVGCFWHEHPSPVNVERYEAGSWGPGQETMDALLLSAQELYRGAGSIDTFRYYVEKLRTERMQKESASEPGV